jgi:uncharacterized protein (UPF0335 family)
VEITKEGLEDFCTRLEGLEDDKRKISEEIKVSIETLADNLEVNKKAIRKFYKEWKEAKKDKEEYTAVDFEADRLLCVTFPEFMSEEPKE